MERLILATGAGARRPPDSDLYLGEDVLEFALGLAVRPRYEPSRTIVGLD
jgi:hypothetical protein